MMISTAEAAFGSNFNLMKAPGLDKTAEFIIALDGPTGNYNFHDAAGSGHSNLAELFWLSNEYNNPGVTSARLYAMDKYNWGAGLSNWGENVVNVLFYDTSIKAQEVNLDLDHYFGDTEAVVMRASYTDGQSAYVAYHAGETNCNHSHTDDGTYVIDMMGERWVSNLPGDSYSLPGYFGGGRWDIYRLRAEGHNTLVINPDRTPGQDLSSVTHVEKLESKPRGAISTMDMSTAYPGATNSVRRGFMLGDDRKSVTVRDEIDLKVKSEVYSFIHTLANIQIVDKNTVILEKSGKKVKVQIATNAASAEILDMDPKPLPTSPVVAGQDANNGYRKLAIHFNESGKIYVQLKFTPMTDAAADKAMEVLPMDEWTIPDGEVQPVPAVDMIYADGAPISNFDPTAGSYLIKVPYGQDKIPAITADTQEGTSVEIHNAADFNDSSTVKVFWDNNPDNYRIYMVSYMVIPKLDDVNGRRCV